MLPGDVAIDPLTLIETLLRKAALLETGAGNETRTRDPDLGKVVLYQLSYSRNMASPRGLEPLLPP
ncbi:hypothetical protein PSEUDO8AS_70076 [Pseudomonas sp. 8AS]|nr:hypothetical protein PSEUDO8AS_70076 [Pseudomonas sp. 8AS]